MGSLNAPRMRGLSGLPLRRCEQSLRFLPPVAAEVAVEQVDHRPQVPALFDVHLEQVAHVVQRRGGVAQQPLLLDARGLGVGLGDDDAPQHAAQLARHVLPRRLAVEIAAGHDAVRVRLGQEDAPPVVGHLHVVEVRPALGVHRDGGAQVDVLGLEALGAHLAPPRLVVGQPGLQSAQQLGILRQVDVVRDLLVQLDAHCLHSLPCLAPSGLEWRPMCVPSRSWAAPVCRTASTRPARRRRWGAGTPSSATPRAVRRPCSPCSRCPRTAARPPCR